MNRFVLAIALACALSGSALAGDVSTPGAPAPGEMPGGGTQSPADKPTVGFTSPGEIPTCLSVVLTMFDLAF